MIVNLILLLSGLLVGGAVAWWLCEFDRAQAKHERAKAERALREADHMLAAAERSALRADALTTPTSEFQTVVPSVTVRFGAAMRTAAEWARDTFVAPVEGPVWAPAELASLAQKPPVRTRGPVAAERSGWPLRPQRLPLSPLNEAAPWTLSYTSLGGAR